MKYLKPPKYFKIAVLLIRLIKKPLTGAAYYQDKKKGDLPMKKEIKILRAGLRLHGLIDIPDQEKFDLVILMHGFTSDLGYTKRRVFYDQPQPCAKKVLAYSDLILMDMEKAKACLQIRRFSMSCPMQTRSLILLCI